MVQKTAFPVFNGYAPAEGPKALPIAFDLTVNPSFEFDLLVENTTGAIQYVQSVYADNSRNPNALVIYFPGTDQRLVVPATAQGIWPVFSTDQVRCVISSTVNPNAFGNIILLNMPMPLTQWGPVTVNTGDITVTSEPYPAAISDAGFTTAPVAPTQFLAANANRRGLILTANSSNIHPVLIFAAGIPLVTLLPGENWQSGSFVPTIDLASQSATGADAEFYWHEFE